MLDFVANKSGDEKDLKCYNGEGKVDISATIQHLDTCIRSGMYEGIDIIELTGFEAYGVCNKTLIDKSLEFARRALELTHSTIEKHEVNGDTIYNADGSIDLIATRKYSLLKTKVQEEPKSKTDILVGYEVLNIEGNLDINESMEFINLSMRNRSPHKYGDFMKKTIQGRLKKAMFVMGIPETKKRLELFQNVYFAMRLLDDIIDGDAPIKISAKDRNELLDSLRNLTPDSISKISSPLLRIMLENIIKISGQLGISNEMTTSVFQIIKSMKFDNKRINGVEKKQKKRDLDNNFHLMDIVGTVAGTALIFGIEPEQAKKMLTPLGQACRLIYNLQDFYSDIKNDIINIPIEDLKKFGITDSELDEIRNFVDDSESIKYISLPDSIRRWFKQEIQKIYELIDKHTEAMDDEFHFECGGVQIFREWIMKKQIIPKTYLDEIERDTFVISRLVA